MGNTISTETRAWLTKLSADVTDASERLAQCGIDLDAANQGRDNLDERIRCDAAMSAALKAQLDALAALEDALKMVRASIPLAVEKDRFDAELQKYRSLGQAPTDDGGTKH